LVEMMADGRELQLGGKKVVLTDWMMVDDLVE
jgi:DNA-directed RNA polymerase delta subunit